MPYIKSISINEFNGAFNQTIQFGQSLNILSGVNGTGKTTVLRRIREQIGNQQTTQVEGGSPKILALSPKRNAEKKTTEATIQFIRQNSRTSAIVLQEALQRSIVDNTFEKYESFGDLYIYEFEERCRSGGDRISTMNNLTSEYNDIVKSVFPEYDLKANWNQNYGSSGGPEVKLITRYGVPLDLSVMSCGESEVFALMFNVYFNKANTDIFLIDEPEIHLNWSLEKGLFKFLNTFADSNSKQIIVTTHSRVIFDQAFRDKVQFLIFGNKKIFVQKDAPPEYLEEIAGEAASIVTTTAPTKKTFFVEDEFQKSLIGCLLEKCTTTAEMVVVKDASGMIVNLYKLIKSNSDINDKWVNAYLVIDGDGKQEMYKKEKRFVHLKRFCAESYLYHIVSLAQVLSTTEDDIRQKILDIIKAHPEYFEGKHQMFLKKMLGKLKKSDIDFDLLSSFDCSQLTKVLLRPFGKNSLEGLIKGYIEILSNSGWLEKVFDKKLMTAIKA